MEMIVWYCDHAILIQTPSHQDILVDGGSSPQAISLALGKKMPFWDRTIELVVLTHPHADHITGLVEVLKRYEVKQVLSPGLDDDSPVYAEWLGFIQAKNVKYTIACAGQQINLGNDVVIAVLNPQTPLFNGTASDMDNNGVVLRLHMGELSFLLTADIFKDTEWELITRRADLSATVLKVAHHGSNTSTTPEFLAVVNPQLAVISVGEDNLYSHPSNEVVERLMEQMGSENIYRTDKHGTIEFIANGERLWVEVER
jgi:competence protein ComEC